MKCRIAVSSCALLILCGMLGSAAAAELPSDAEVARQARQLLLETAPANGPGEAILLARGDQVIFRGARGMAQMELDVPLRADDVFPIGSDTKQFTAVTILKLSEQGRLALTDPVSRFLPDYPDGAHITIHELLNHTSGIKDYTAIDDYSKVMRKDVDTGQLIALFKDLPPDFAPGTNWSYDNSGYVLLGAVIEKIAGKPWYEAERELVLAPLALTETRYGDEQPIIAGRVAGYSLDGQGHVVNAPYLSMSQAHAAGGLVSNVDDLFHWLRALHTGKVLKGDSYRRMTTPVPNVSGKPTDYGYGVFTRSIRGQRAFEHGGRTPGFTSETLYLPAAAITVVVLSNTDSSAPLNEVAAELAADVLGDPYPRRQPIKLDTAQMQALAGTYKNAEGDQRTVVPHGDKLYTAHDGGPEHQLLAASPDLLFFDEVLDYFTVTRDAAGNVTALEKFPDGEGPPEQWRKIGGLTPAAQPKKRDR